MPSDRLRASLLRDYDAAGERDLFRAMLELHVADSDLWKAFDPDALAKVLKEPRYEHELRRPVKNYLKEEWDLDRIAPEVPLNPKSSHNVSKADIIGFKKKFLGGKQLYAVELKSSATRGAIRQAFAQAKEYQKYCEFATACFSPLVYMNYLDDLDREIKEAEYGGVGIWIASTDRVLFELRKPGLNDARSGDHEAIIGWIADHEY